MWAHRVSTVAALTGVEEKNNKFNVNSKPVTRIAGILAVIGCGRQHLCTFPSQVPICSVPSQILAAIPSQLVHPLLAALLWYMTATHVIDGMKWANIIWQVSDSPTEQNGPTGTRKSHMPSIYNTGAFLAVNQTHQPAHTATILSILYYAVCFCLSVVPPTPAS